MMKIELQTGSTSGIFILVEEPGNVDVVGQHVREPLYHCKGGRRLSLSTSISTDLLGEGEYLMWHSSL